MSRKLAVVASLIFALHLSVLAQDKPTETEADKQKKQEDIDKRFLQLIERSIADADSLRLPQNRAVVYGITGDLYWKYDEKRSRELFRNAANELIAFNLEAEADKTRAVYNSIFDISARSEVLPLIAKHD